jgi:predicted nucleotidyltransferase
MRNAAPGLLPLFRSRSQADLLTETFLHPEQEYSIAELARRSAVPLSTVHREVARLLDAGLLTEHRVGNVRRVAAKSDSPLFQPMRELIERAFGPRVRLADALRPLGQVRQAWLFGSYARRLNGEPGEAPNDVDVAVVVDGNAEAVYQICARMGAELGLEVNATVFTQAEWDDPDDVFVRQLREGTLIDLLGQPDVDGNGG